MWNVVVWVAIRSEDLYTLLLRRLAALLLLLLSLLNRDWLSYAYA